MNVVEIPKGQYDSPGPCWLEAVDLDGKPMKPSIKCQCGMVCCIDLHHVHADGTVTASFWHAVEPNFEHKGKKYWHSPGCGWHEWIKLKDYDQGDFPPVED